MEPDLILEDISFAYPNGPKVLEDVSLIVNCNEAIGIIGENGAGKTTLIKHFNGLLRPTKGNVKIKGQNTKDYSPAKIAQWVGLCFQNPDDQLFQSSVEKEIGLGPKNLGYDVQKTRLLMEWALKLVGLNDKTQYHPYDLDLSNRKLITIASILAMDTPIVILDEPTTGQDHYGIQVLNTIIKTLIENNKTVITVSHDMEFIANNFKRVIVMADGKILLDDRVDVVFNNINVLSKAQVEPPILQQLTRRLGFDNSFLSINKFIRFLKSQIYYS